MKQLDKYRDTRWGRFGLTCQTLGDPACPYMHRIILWLGFGTLRLHQFLRSDSDRHLHDHPWWFITFPLTTYRELVPGGEEYDDTCRRSKTVRRFKFHYRPATYKHAVVLDKPGWTIVLTGNRQRGWGFWIGNEFSRYREYFNKFGHVPCE